LNEESKKKRQAAVIRSDVDGSDDELELNAMNQESSKKSPSSPKRKLSFTRTKKREESEHVDNKGNVIVLKADFTIRRPAEFMFKMKIMLTFLQIVTNLGISLAIPWPIAFQRFISFFSFANIDIIQASSVGCVVDASFYKKFLMMTIAPAVVLISVK